MDTQGQPRQPGPGPSWAYRQQAFANLLRMGHCAPTVMQTLLDVSPTERPTQGDWLVRLSAGMPGGIGNTGHECGAVTSPLALMGVKGGLREMDRGLPVLFDRGHALCAAFVACHDTLQCRGIRTKGGFPRQCIGPVLRSAELWRDALDGDRSGVIPEGTRAAMPGSTHTSPRTASTAPRPCSLSSATPRPPTPSSSMPRRPSWGERYSWEGPAARSSRA